MVTAATLRELALALPDAEEVPTWGGDPGFKVHGKLFAHLYPDGDRLSVKIDPHERELLLRAEPRKFACTVRSMPFVEVGLASIDREELAELLEEAWRLAAPRSLVAAFDERRERLG